MTSTEIISALELKWTLRKMTSLLKSMNGIDSFKVKKNTYYKVKRDDGGKQGELALV
jgi:hypothetical protein